MAVAPWIVSDKLWELFEPLLPKKERRFRYPGRKRFDDRLALQGILFVLHTGVAWQHLPPELGFGSGVTCWRRLDEWQRAGVWDRLHALLLERLRAAGEIEWSRAIVDSSQVQAKKGAPKRARARSTEAVQAPSSISSSTRPGSRLRLGHGEQPQRRHPTDPAARRGAGGRRPPRPAASKTGSPARRSRLRPRQVPSPRPATRRQARDRASPDRAWLGARTSALGCRAHLRLVAQLKRLLVRYERRGDIHHALLALGCSLVCFRRLRSSI